MKFLLTISVCLTTAFAQEVIPQGRYLGLLPSLPVSQAAGNSLDPVRATAPDGTVMYLLRFSSEGGAATRLLLRDFHLPAGSAVFVYGTEGQPVGPFTGTGPVTGSDEFWTPPVEGGTAIVEFQPGASDPATLPFEVAEVSAVSPRELALYRAPLPQAGESSSETRTTTIRDQAVSYTVRDGYAVLEGDILLGEVGEPAAGSAKHRLALGMPYDWALWPNGVVPYVIDPGLANPDRVTAAMSQWTQALGGGVRFVPRSTEDAYVIFQRGAYGTCSSFVGRLGFAQPSNIGDGCTTGNVVHEIGHLLGLFHEHTRPDRDSWVRVNWGNIDSSAAYNFSTISYGRNLGGYDYNSIMHYPSTAFSINGQATIEPLIPGVQIGQRTTPSAGDIAGIAELYRLSSPPPPPPPVSTGSVTLTTNPPGLQVIVDGVAVTTPYTTPAAPAGTVRKISAPAIQYSGAGRYAFASWNNGGAQSFAYSQAAGQAAFTASFAAQFPLAANAGYGGSVSVTPASPDGFFAAGTALQLTATPWPGYCFSGWTGLLPGTPASTWLTLDRSYHVTANFGTGAVTLNAMWLLAHGGDQRLAVGVSGSSGCGWKASSNVDWISFPNGSAGSGSANLDIAIARNPTPYIRVGRINVGTAMVFVYQYGN